MSTIEKIRQEIEKRRLHFNKEAEKYQALNNGYSQNCYGARDALKDLENFLDTFETEAIYDTQQYTPRPSVSIEDVARVQFASHAHVFDRKRKAVFDWEQFKEVAGIFYGFGKRDSLPEEHLRDSTKMISEDLEESAERAARKVYPYEGGMKGIICETSIPIFKAGFIAGAKWQKEQDTREMVMSDGSYFQKCYALGKKDMKEQMLKDAVEGEVVQDLKGRFHVKTNAVSDILYQFGDKVKVIILKQ